MPHKNKKETVILLFIIATAALLRFFNIMHDSPYFFNPDERNMANAISQFRLPNNLKEIPICILSQFRVSSFEFRVSSDCNLNPHFFSYGQFPLYLAFFSDQISRISPISQITDSNHLSTPFPSAIFWLRFWSVLSSVLTVLLVFLISRKLFSFPLFAATLAAFTPGLIQSAHFGTTESLLTFFFLTSIYLSFKLFEKPIITPARGWSALGGKYLILLSLSIGLALGSKLTGVFFFIPLIISMMIRIIELLRKRGKKKFSGLLGYWIIGLLLFIGSIFIFALSSPYNLVEPESFKSAVFGYESDVATGKYEAFYTRQFVNTTPIIFQVEKIFPYALGWPVFTFGTVGFLFMSISLISKLIQTIVQSIKYQVLRIRYKKEKNKNILNTYYLILTTSFLFYLLPNAFLFAKWTRFMIPVLPFFAIFAGYFIYKLNLLLNLFPNYQLPITNYQTNSKFKIKNSKNLIHWLLRYCLVIVTCILIIVSILPGLSFMSIYTHDDSRVQASRWIYENIPTNSYVLSETANVVDIPVGIASTAQKQETRNYQVTSFDFYHMDENQILFAELLTHLEKANYIFIPSRRIFANYTKLPGKYPLVTKYYQLLFSGALGFEKATEINSFPILGPWQFPDEQAEETFTVFDHPVVRTYRKVKPFTIDEYRSLFRN